MGEKAKELLKLRFDKRLGLDLLKHIVRGSLFCFNWRQYSLLIITIALLVLSALASCGPSIEDLLAVDYTPLPGEHLAAVHVGHLTILCQQGILKWKVVKYPVRRHLPGPLINLLTNFQRQVTIEVQGSCASAQRVSLHERE